MSEKPKSSLISRIASHCGLLYIAAILILAFTPMVGGAVGGLISLICSLVIPAFGIAGITLGIIALCKLTPEEKAERVWTSGTTKNLAVVGIVVPPAMTLLGLLIYFIARVNS